MQVVRLQDDIGRMRGKAPFNRAGRKISNELVKPNWFRWLGYCARIVQNRVIMRQLNDAKGSALPAFGADFDTLVVISQPNKVKRINLPSLVNGDEFRRGRITFGIA